jgi:lipopolysaccharide transport system ATP-binding protein
MDEITKKDGRTILFVSHNMGVIQNLCTKTILLEKGCIKMFDRTDKVIHYYLNSGESAAITEFPVDMSKDAQISKITIQNNKDVPQAKLLIDEDFSINVKFSVFQPLSKTMLSLIFYNQGEVLLFASQSDKSLQLDDLEVGDYSITVKIPAFLFNTGIFFFDAVIHKPMVISFDYKKNIGFEILEDHNPRSIIFGGNSQGTIATLLDFKSEKLKL